MENQSKPQPNNATYTDREGNEWPEETWTTEDGRKILIQDLEPEHAKNIIRMILRNEREYDEFQTAVRTALETLFAQVEREETGQLLN